MKLGRLNFIHIGAGLLLCSIGLNGAKAADLPSTKEVNAPAVAEPRTPWFVRVGVAGVLFDESATISLGGMLLPGASLRASDNISAMFEVGYYLNDNISFQLTGGYPPTTHLTGIGTASAFGSLGKVTYGPAALTVSYHLTNFGAFVPYVGGGFVYGIIFGTSDGAVKNLRVDNAPGAAVQGGFDYYLNRNWSVFAEAKKLFLSLNAHGYAAGLPATARITANPIIVSGGLSYHW